MLQSPQEPSSLCIPCTKPRCNRWFRNRSGYTQHMNAKHPTFLMPPHSPSLAPDITDFEFIGTGDRLYRNYHPFLSGKSFNHSILLNNIKKYTHTYIAHPCDPDGTFLPPGAPPPPITEKSLDDWTPYGSHIEFKLADYLFTKNQTPTHSIDQLLNIWAASLVQAGSKCTVFSDHHNLYKKIDNTPLGDVKWQSFSVKYTGAIPDEGALPWMEDSHDVWFHDPCKVVRNMLTNPDFAMEMNLQPYREFATENHECQWKDFMSGDWSWAHTDKISKDPDTHGSTFVPVILGSDKTTVSVATGQNDYYPLYASISNVQNNVCCAHCNAVALFHSSLSFILKNLKPAMMKPEVAHFRDGHYWRVIYRLGPYIADYEEQVLLACILRNWCAKCLSCRRNLNEINICRSRSHTNALIKECDSGMLKSEYGLVGKLVPFTNNFPCADIHELLTPDILHQLIKGAYKDHLVKITAVPPFPGLCRFPQGRHFKQWTGDDSKALMKVYLPAIEGYVPVDVVHAFRALLEFCYLVHHNVITEKSLSEIEDALTWFHTYCKVFKTTGVVTTFSLPRQHSMSHYVHLIRLFSAPNGLCSLIMESKHIKAVKEPWRHSSQFKVLGQMLLINQRLDKLAASCVDFCVHGMLTGTCLSAVLTSLKPSADSQPAICSAQTDAEEPHTDLDLQEPSMPKSAKGRKRAQSVHALANELDILHLADLVSQFLVGQLYPDMDPTEVPDSLIDCPWFDVKIWVFNSAVSVFFALSNLSGIGGMKHEYIRVSPKWRSGHACKDCMFVITDPNAHGMQGMDIAQVLTFFSF
ncbi:hypothetical protein BD769DRAFT_1631154 [Suillus cothurnatus]|nr:hypothetical protein BD769DRAFT_1631154 [Suillus cothurnatus]